MNRHEPRQEKLQGYLEKRSKMNFWRWWRKYWFVLDGKMLLYYKTKENYELLGRCKGSINMALAQAAQPSCTTRRSYPLEIITRTKTIQLSACDEENRQKWLSALQNAIRLPEVSSPIFQRLSSRLSGNIGKFFPDSDPDDALSTTDSLIQLERHAEENEDETDTLDKPPSGRKRKISFKEEDTKEEIHTIYTACASERHISTYSFSEDHDTSDINTTQPDSSDASTITLLDEASNDCKPTFKGNSLSAKASGRFRPRSRSLYDEILDEVLEITGQRLPSSRTSSTTRNDNDHDPVFAEELPVQDQTLVEETFSASATENGRGLSNAAMNHSIKCCPPKPPRMPSKKFTAKKEASSNARKKVFQTEADKTLNSDNSQEGELEGDAYDSASESCYVTAESSDYEGDNSSVNSSNCNLDQHIATCANLPAQIINACDNLPEQINHSSDTSQDKTPRESSVHACDKNVSTTEVNRENTELYEAVQSQNLISRNSFQTRVKTSDDNLNSKSRNSMHELLSNSTELKVGVLLSKSDDTQNQITKTGQEEEISGSYEELCHSAPILANSIDEHPTELHDDTVEPIVVLFETMESTGEENQLVVQPLTPSALLSSPTVFLSPTTYEASLASQESLESVKPQTGSLCNMLDVTDDEDDDVFMSPPKLPESSTPHPVCAYSVKQAHFSPINDAPPMKASQGYSFSVVRSAELVWTCESQQAKPRKYSQ